MQPASDFPAGTRGKQAFGCGRRIIAKVGTDLQMSGDGHLYAAAEADERLDLVGLVNSAKLINACDADSLPVPW